MNLQCQDDAGLISKRCISVLGAKDFVDSRTLLESEFVRVETDIHTQVCSSYMVRRLDELRRTVVISAVW